ncbi:MAG: hypothetical protein IID15_02305 [Candidatus Marinimicrobia bacterium]|nr:hypothetical protein [Candidatus Neomarinimicrobiota bacterium]
MKAYFSADKTYDLARIRLYDLSGIPVDSINAPLSPQNISNTQPWSQGLGYELTFSYTVPDLPSGIYQWEQTVPIVIRDPDNQLPIRVLYPSNTAAAYNNDGGKSLYPGNSTDRAPADSLSFHRRVPLDPLALECLMLFATQRNLEMGYLIDQDMDDYSNLEGTQLLIIIGHSEYWTRSARKNFDKFVDSGGHALILSGNTMWWQVRYSADGTRLIGFKSALDDDIADPLLATILWNDPQLQYPIMPSTGTDFDHGGYGIKFEDAGWDGVKIIRPNAPYLAETGLRAGDIISLPSLEYDGTAIAGYDSTGFPYPDSAKLGFPSIDIIGFDYGFRGKQTVGTWIQFQKSESSGIIINTGTTDWCSENGVGGLHGELLGEITLNMINYLLAN